MGKEKKHISSSSLNSTFLIAFIILLALLSFAAFFRNTTWKNDLIWDDVINKGPNKPRAYNNRGIAYNKKGQYDRAIEDYNKCVSNT